MRTPLGSPRQPRGVFVVVLLLLALGLAVVLAFQAQVAAVYHRATADRVLRDYAAFAAARFASRAAQEVYGRAVTPALAALQRAAAAPDRRRLPTPAELGGPDSVTRAFLARCRYTFEFRLETGRLRTGGAPPGSDEARWLADTLAVHARTVYRSDWYFAVVFGKVGGAHRMLAYRLLRDAAGAPERALGVGTVAGALEPVLQLVTDGGPLLPAALTRGVASDSLGSVIVRDAQGTEVYRSPQHSASPFTGRDSLGAYLGGLQVEITLRPETARLLVIGGLPKSRLPFLLGLLALTTGVIGAALFLLRREYAVARLRAEFVSGVSHELRTPLAQIRMFSETLLLGRVRSKDEERRSLAIIDQEARRLTHLVDNLLHFSRSERRLTRVALERAELAPLVREAVEGFTPLAAARRTALRTELAEGVVASVDAGALRQMLLNLLDNAVKYSAAGQTVTIRLKRLDERVRIWVDDQGPGIPPGERERVWERFWRLERDRGSPVAGTGIGLAVVRELVALHDGRAWVEDAPGGGARFVLELPTAPPGSAPRTA